MGFAFGWMGSRIVLYALAVWELGCCGVVGLRRHGAVVVVVAAVPGT